MKRLELTPPQLEEARLGFFRFGRLPNVDQVVLTNEAGEFQLVESADFTRFLKGEIGPDDPLHGPLADKGFLREGSDLNALADRVARKKSFLDRGPHLHAVVTTLRCNQSCAYCHASRTDMDRVDTDMSLETARQVVDFALRTPSPYVNFEFQGGEPTVRIDVIKFLVEYSREKNKAEGKTLDHSLVTNMTYMNEENARWLIDNRILICTSLDGPEDLHNKNRAWRKGGNAYGDVIRWIKWFNAAYVEKGLDPELWHVDALMTTTRNSLSRAKEIVDLYVELGIRNIHLRPLNPFGFATKTWKAIGYSMEEFMVFYEEALDYILELNRQGVQIQEGRASVFLSKMLTPDDPAYVDIRSPIGSGTGQIAYDYDGSIYPSDEGRMVAAGGDPIFKLGHVASSTWDEVAQHPTVRSLAVASYLDALPQCSTCFNAPWCGVRPLHNYMLRGSLFEQRPNTLKCEQHMTIAHLLLERLHQDTIDTDAPGEVERIFRRWTINRPRQED